MKNIAGIIIGLIGIGAGIFGLVERKHIMEVNEKLEGAIDTLSENVVVDIQEAIVDQAVDRAVERKANAMVETSVNRARDDVQQEIRRRIREAVDSEFERQKPDISGRLAAEAEKIDMEALKKEVTEKAEKAILKRFYEMGGIPKIYGAFNGLMDHVERTNLPANLSTQSISDILSQFTFDNDKRRALEVIFGKNNQSDYPF